ncbi:MAG: hypothetical protein M0035_01910, partial [Actinomycetota bacterium]|nr:hypothetical protein [Actinomycetota bacterium]
RRIVDLAMAIAHDPSVLILDEPSSGIAQRETEALGPLLVRIQRETGCAMLVIEHDMPLITSISDEMIALDLGTVVVRGTPDEVVNDPRVVAAYLGNEPATTARSGAGTGIVQSAPIVETAPIVQSAPIVEGAQQGSTERVAQGAQSVTPTDPTMQLPRYEEQR